MKCLRIERAVAWFGAAVLACGATAQVSVDRGITFQLEWKTSTGFPVRPILSADGRSYVGAERSHGRYNLVHYDRPTGVATTVSTNWRGRALNDFGFLYADISDTGRYVVYATAHSDIVPGDKNDFVDVFRHDRATSHNVRVSVIPNSARGANSGSFAPFVSGSGRYVVFESTATDLVANDPNERLTDVYLRDMIANTTTRIGTSSATAFSSDAHIAGETHLCYNQYDAFNQPGRIMRYEIATGAKVTIATLSSVYDPKISRDGAVIAYANWTTMRVEHWRNGRVTVGPPITDPRVEVSPNGRFVAYADIIPFRGQVIWIWDTLTQATFPATATVDGAYTFVPSGLMGHFGKCDTLFAFHDGLLKACYLDFGIEYPTRASIGRAASFKIVSDPTRRGLAYQLGHSFGAAPPIPIPGDAHRSIPLAADGLLVSSITNATMFAGYAGTLDANGAGTGTFRVPPLTQLIGAQFFTAGIAYDASGIVGITGARRTTLVR